MTQSAPTKLPVSCLLYETVQVAHHDREALRPHQLDYDIWNFMGLDSKHILGRPTIMADVNAMHCASPKSRA
jgi:hypothetical protein